MSTLTARTSLSDPIGVSVPLRGMNMVTSPSAHQSRPYTYRGTGYDVLTPPNKRVPPRNPAKIMRSGIHTTNCYCNICNQARSTL